MRALQLLLSYRTDAEIESNQARQKEAVPKEFVSRGRPIGKTENSPECDSMAILRCETRFKRKEENAKKNISNAKSTGQIVDFQLLPVSLDPVK